MIDLRSDTVTKPSIGMLEHMMLAKVGDDVFGEDPTVTKLEKRIATIFGKPAALFCPSGTMANQISIKLNTQPMDEVICDQSAHIYHYEVGGPAFNSQVSLKLLNGDLGRFTAADVLENINPDEYYYAKTSLICIENTVNRGGGCVYSLESIKEIAKVAKEEKLKMHLDGARIFNAMVKSGDEAEDIGACFDTLSVCFSKGLGAPIGSAIVGSKEAILKAKRIRKAFGGGMRQAGYLAAACLYALDKNIERLKVDHRRADELANIFEDKPYIDNILAAGTNIVILSLTKDVSVEDMLLDWKSRGVLALPFGKQEIRLVTHMDFTDDMLQKIKDTID
ncbi:MAG: aminotransferase class I/II-fold pyridoxal phosphate-dependent enzyme [Reichenbachiella sp.]